jgi:hypothetical protein
MPALLVGTVIKPEEVIRQAIPTKAGACTGLATD